MWEDLESFAGVCTPWRIEAADPQNNFRYKCCQQIPWLIKNSPDLRVCILHPFSRLLQLQQPEFPSIKKFAFEYRIKPLPDKTKDLEFGIEILIDAILDVYASALYHHHHRPIRQIRVRHQCL